MHKFYFGLLAQTALIGALFCLNAQNAAAQTNETMAPGSYIIDMGSTSPTEANSLHPYGMIYEMLTQYKVPVKWVISGTKAKDQKDFTYNGVEYKGGPFILPAEYLNGDIELRINTYWKMTQGVNVVKTTSPVTVPVYTTLYAAPKWTLDRTNGAFGQGYLDNALIPSTAYGGTNKNAWPLPADLDCCDDLFIMPHADPKWITHANLYDWNLDCKGALFLGCHAGSAMEDMFDNVAPVNFNTQTNFLAEKTGPASGGGPYSENALLLWGTHDGNKPVPPYSYDFPNEPVMQFMGKLDAATLNGSEQVYVPKSPGWRPTTKVGVYDPDYVQRYQPYVDPKHRPAVLAWGPGLGDANRGLVMMIGGHQLDKASAPDNIAAQRAFLNFSFLTMSTKVVPPTISGLPSVVQPGVSYPISFDVPAPADPNDYTVVWSSSCGTFTPNTTTQSVSFIPQNVSNSTPCNISVTIKDMCGRESFSTGVTTIECGLQITKTITNPCFNAPNTGSIQMSITGGSPVYNFNWAKSGGGTGSGTGTTISGLSAGSYTVTVTANGGSGCSSTFTATVSLLPQIVINSTAVNPKCFNGNGGSISLSVSGGTPGYTYLWNGGATTQNLSSLTAGTYTVTVTDSKSCTATQSVTLTQPAAITATTAITNVNCFGGQTGAIDLTPSGGTPPYTYQWSNGASTQDVSGLFAGTYTVAIRDANNCTKFVLGLQVTQPSLALTLSSTKVNVSCNGGSNGTITVTPTGGTSPFTYDWNGTPTGDGTNTITGLSAGTYTVTVTDSKGCTAVHSATITQPAVLTLSTVITHPTCLPSGNAPLNADGAIDLSVAGGTAPYTYNWTDLTPPPAEPQDRTGLAAGTYTVTVTDNKGCTATTSATLTNLNPNPVQPGMINH